MKKAKIVKRKIPTADVELNRWCIEMAMKWPVITSFSGSSSGVSFGGPSQQVDADVLSRANKIKDWVNR